MPAARFALALAGARARRRARFGLALAAGDHVALRTPGAVGHRRLARLGPRGMDDGAFPGRSPGAGRRGRLGRVRVRPRRRARAAGIRGYEVVGWFGAAAPAEHSSGLEYLGTLDGVRATVIARRIELLVWARDGVQRAARRRRRGYRSLRADRRCLPRPAGADDRGEPAVRGAARPRAARDDRLGVVPLHDASALPADLAALEAVLRPRDRLAVLPSWRFRSSPCWRSRSSSRTRARCSTGSGGSGSGGASSTSSSCGRWCRTPRPPVRSGARRATSG